MCKIIYYQKYLFALDDKIMKSENEMPKAKDFWILRKLYEWDQTDKRKSFIKRNKGRNK